jgi:hypothetical protein
MLGSLTHADINCAYSLFAYFALHTHRQNNSLKEMLAIIIVATILIAGSDVWSIYLLQFEEIGEAMRALGYVWMILEIALKLVLLVMLIMWKTHKSELPLL